ncbi:MAG: hypothetical protein CENE_01512 [Candidatus Celerinatantimonas neptuna]|nr:MAG: hypothetical protein CENE_01512 [Candidatus Celerinatantimonas neptuna]
MHPLLCEATLQQLADDIGSSLLPELFAVFIEENEPKLANLQDPLVHPTSLELKSLFHTLKSSAASYGGLRLAALASELDTACKDQQYDKVDALLPEFMMVYTQTLEVMKQRY